MRFKAQTDHQSAAQLPRCHTRLALPVDSDHRACQSCKAGSLNGAVPEEPLLCLRRHTAVWSLDLIRVGALHCWLLVLCRGLKSGYLTALQW